MIFQNVFENMNHKKLSLLKELLVHKASRENPSKSSTAEMNAQGKAEWCDVMLRWL